MNLISPYIYLIAAICFILSIKGLASPSSARKGNAFGMTGMGLAIIATLCLPGMQHHFLILSIMACGAVIGGLIALRVNMTAIPQLVAGFHSLVGLAAVMVAYCAFLTPKTFGLLQSALIKPASMVEMTLGLVIGAITFSGSIIAFLKLQGWMSGKPIGLPLHSYINALIALCIVGLTTYAVVFQQLSIFNILMVLAIILGVLLIIPIGGADMPVVISMLNSYSGWAAAGIGFTLSNQLLVITGALVGASGAILSYIMCKGMNRSFFNVIFAGIPDSGEDTTISNDEDKQAQQGNGEDAAFLISKAKEVIIVPGYGMAVSQAQHAIKELFDMLTERGIRVRFAIHPVAGRMPGHMNVLLAEANIPYDCVLEQDEINRDFANCDIAYVIGANDITNPVAKSDPSSPIYGMPILEVENARTILFVKRSLAPGYSGVDNELFYRDNTYMLFDDAKHMTESIVAALESL